MGCLRKCCASGEAEFAGPEFVARAPSLRVRYGSPLSGIGTFWALGCRQSNAMVYAFPTRFLDKVEREVNHLATPWFIL
jgi:hypothetical protein